MSDGIPYWIQRADFSTRDLRADQVEALVDAFTSHDWTAELELESDRARQEKERCPPGFGIVPGDGRILHLCPQSDDTVMLHYHYPVTEKILWLIPTKRTQVATATSIPLNSAAEIVRAFIEANHEAVMSRVAV